MRKILSSASPPSSPCSRSRSITGSPPTRAERPGIGATFTAIQPADEYGQFGNVWTHDFTVTVNPDGTFTGTGVQDGHDQNGVQHFTETVNGKFSDSNTKVTFTVTRNDGAVWTLTNAPTDNTTITLATMPSAPDAMLEFKVTAPVFSGNHGDCVSGAAHAGIKGKALAAIAQDNTKVGDYGSATCAAVN